MFRVSLLLGAGLVACAMSLQQAGGIARPEDNKGSDGVKVSGRVFGTVAAEGNGKPVKKAAGGAAIHLRDLPHGWDAKPSADPVTLKFIKGRLVPAFACLQVGQRLVVKAPEGERLALYAHSRERGEYARVIPAAPNEFIDRFPKPDDFVALACAIHPTAQAHLQVVPTPEFTLCDAEGQFTLPRRLPPGRHVLKAFLPGMGWDEKTVTLRGDEGTVTVEIELAPRSKERPPVGVLDIGFAEEGIAFSHRYLVFTPDDKYLLSIGYDAAVRVWEVRTGKRVKTLWLPREQVGRHHANYADLSPDGCRLAIPGGRHLLVIDLSGDRVTAVGRGHADWIHDLAFSPDGKQIATVGEDRLLKLWDPGTGACTATFQAVGPRAFSALAWSPGGKTIATSEDDGPVRLWDVGTGQARALTKGAVYGWKLLWRPDGQAVGILGHPRGAFAVDPTGRIVANDKKHERWTTIAARFTPDGRLALAEDGRVVEAATGRGVGPCPGHPRVGDAAALSDGGDLYATQGEDGELVVRSLVDGKVRMRVPAPPRESAKRVGSSADGKSLLWTAVRPGPFPQPAPAAERAFDLARLKLGVPPAHATRTTARFKDATRAITKEEYDYGYTLTRIKDGMKLPLAPSSSADDFAVHAVTLLAGERAALHSDWGLALHDTATGDELFYYRPAPEGHKLAPTPDGRFFAAGGKAIGVYSPPSPDRLLALHVLGDRWVAWTADGHYAASWDGDLPVGWFIDHGPEKLAEFVPLNQLKGRNRPDVIRRLLTAGSLEKARGQAPLPPQGPKNVTPAEKKAFLELFEKLPTEHEGLYAEEAIDKAEPYLRVLLALTEKEIEQYGMNLGIKKEHVCLYSFHALSVGLLERNGPREYGVKYFGEIAHPKLKLGWAVGLFNQHAASPEVVRFLRAALESEERARDLRAMYGPDFEWFKKRLREALPEAAIFPLGPTDSGARQDAPGQSPVTGAVENSKRALVLIQEAKGKSDGKEGTVPRSVLGILIDAKGAVVTNYSLIKGWKKLAVVLSDGRRLPAKAMRSDPDLDLAVIHVEDPKPLPHATVGDSENLKVGDFVLALSAPWTVAVEELPVSTRGIIAGKARTTKKGDARFTVDTATGPACSPGPLIDRRGQFIGLVVSRDLVPRGTNGAIPSKRILERLAEWSKEGRAKPPVLEVEAKPRAAFGIGGFSCTDTAYAFSPDGKYFAVGGYGILLLRDAQTGKVLCDLGEELEKVRCDVHCVAFSPESKTLAVGGYYGGRLLFWDVAARKWGASLEGHTGTVLAVAFSPDGKSLASGGTDGTLRFWDVCTAKETAKKKPHGDWVFAVAFSPDGKALASAGADNDVVLWDLAAGKPRRRLRGHENAIDALVFSADGKLLASGSRDGTSRLWDPTTGNQVRQFPGSVGTFSPDGKYWISCGLGRLVVWDVATGARQAHILRPAPVFLPLSLAVSPNGKTLAVRCDSERIYLWDLDPLLPAEKAGKLHSPVFSPDGKGLVARSGDRTLRFWDAASGQERKRIVLTLDRDEQADWVGYDTSGAVLVLLEKYEGFRFDSATGWAMQGTIISRLWNTSTRKKSPPIKTGFGGRAIDPGGKLLAYGSGLWDIATGKQIRKYALPEGLIYGIKFSADGKTLAYWLCESLAQNTSIIVLVDVATGKKLLQVGDLALEVSNLRFRSPATFSADGKAIVFSEMQSPPDYPILLWSVSGAREMQRIPQKAPADLLAFSAGGKTLLSWERRHGLVHFWETASGKERRSIKIEGGVQSLTFSPDGKSAALVNDGTIEFRKLEE
jgi:WD40 repeat protein/S1-C subfamily serine protease